VDEVEVKASHVELCWVLGVVRGAAMADRDSQPGIEFAHSEGLGHVVIGTTIQRFDLAVFGAVRGQHDDGHVAPGPNPRVGSPPAEHTEPMIVVGRHCEAGDVLIPDARLPRDVGPGDLLVVPATGAYHHAMASNYNHFTRPPVIAVRGGRARPLIGRETDEDMLHRDVG